MSKRLANLVSVRQDEPPKMVLADQFPLTEYTREHWLTELYINSSAESRRT